MQGDKFEFLSMFLFLLHLWNPPLIRAGSWQVLDQVMIGFQPASHLIEK